MIKITLGQLKEYIISLPHDYEGVGIFDVHPWQGSYDEPSFSFNKSVNKGHMINLIQVAITAYFEGCKGGVFSYDKDSPVNFDEYGVYSNGDYFTKWISKNYDSDFFKGLIKFCAETSK